MRKYISFVLVLFSISCANENKASKAEYDMVLESAESFEDEFQGKEITLEQLTSQKLEDYFELLFLQKRHPQFKGEIEKQLKSYSKDEIFNTNESSFYEVANIRQVGETIRVSDSVVKLKLAYDKVSVNNNNADTIYSLYAVVTKKTIQLDEITTISNEITFERVD